MWNASGTPAPRRRPSELRHGPPPGAVLGSTRDTGAAEPGALRGATVGATGRPGAPVWGHWAFSLSMRDSSTAEGLRQFVMSFLMISACISGLSAWQKTERKADEGYGK